MNNKSVGSKEAADKLVQNIRRKTARKYSAEEKIRIVLAGLRGEESIAALPEGARIVSWLADYALLRDQLMVCR